jgi:hypothetical protein
LPSDFQGTAACWHDAGVARSSLPTKRRRREPRSAVSGAEQRSPQLCHHDADGWSAWRAEQPGHSVERFLRTCSKWLEGDEDERGLDALEGWLAEPPMKKEAQSVQNAAAIRAELKGTP